MSNTNNGPKDVYSRIGRIKDDLGNLIKELEAKHPMDRDIVTRHFSDLEEVHDHLEEIVNYDPTDEEIKAS